LFDTATATQVPGKIRHPGGRERKTAKGSVAQCPFRWFAPVFGDGPARHPGACPRPAESRPRSFRDEQSVSRWVGRASSGKH